MGLQADFDESEQLAPKYDTFIGKREGCMKVKRKLAIVGLIFGFCLSGTSLAQTFGQTPGTTLGGKADYKLIKETEGGHTILRVNKDSWSRCQPWRYRGKDIWLEMQVWSPDFVPMIGIQGADKTIISQVSAPQIPKVHEYRTYWLATFENIVPPETAWLCIATWTEHVRSSMLSRGETSLDFKFRSAVYEWQRGGSGQRASKPRPKRDGSLYYVSPNHLCPPNYCIDGYAADNRQQAVCYPSDGASGLDAC